MLLSKRLHDSIRIPMSSVEVGSLGERIQALHEEIRRFEPGIERMACALYDPRMDLLHTFVNSTEVGTPLTAYAYKLADSASLAELAKTGRTRVIDVADNLRIDRSFWDFQLGFDAAWELDFWGRLRSEGEAEAANFLATVADRDNAIVSLTAEVARSYAMFRTYEVLLAQARTNITLQEDGRLNELILGEFLGLSLHQTPGLTHVSSAREALELAKAERRFNLIVTTPHLGGMDASQLAREVREAKLDVPVVVLAYDNEELKRFTSRRDVSDIERVFLWQGDARILVAIVKSVEDRRPPSQQVPSPHTTPQPPQLPQSSWTSAHCQLHQASPGAHSESQLPPLQQVPSPQTVPQAPQLALSLRMSTHWSPHHVHPSGHSDTQFPLAQQVPSPQTFPQAPQFCGSWR